MPRFAANLSLLFNEVELIERFRLARRCGFDAVEIQFPYSMNAEAIERVLTEQNQQLILFNVPADDLLKGGEGLACVPEKQDLFRRAVDQALAYAEALKPACINVLPGCCFDSKKTPKYLETFKQNLLYAADAFSALGVKTVFEAINTFDMPGFILHGGEKMLAVLDELNHPGLYLQYDIYHMQMMGEDALDFIARHAGSIGHIQFADCPGRGQPGTGHIDFDRLFSAIDESGYAGWVGAEYKPQGATAESLGWFKKLYY
ncbi:MAG: hydroxypyruvate isomerase family protein [Gammaproteobacteria bacterium]